MRRLLFALLLLGAIVMVDDRARAGMPVDAIDLLLGFSAKEGCSCSFDVGQTDDYCTAFGQQPGYVVDMTFDHTNQIVSATFLTTTRTAHVNGNGGCVLDPIM